MCVCVPPPHQAYLDAAFGVGQTVFTRGNISTPATVGGLDGCAVAGGKTRQLLELTSRLGLEPAEIMFFDDDRSNVQQVRRTVLLFGCVGCDSTDTHVGWVGLGCLSATPGEARWLSTQLRVQHALQCEPMGRCTSGMCATGWAWAFTKGSSKQRHCFLRGVGAS